MGSTSSDREEQPGQPIMVPTSNTSGLYGLLRC